MALFATVSPTAWSGEASTESKRLDTHRVFLPPATTSNPFAQERFPASMRPAIADVLPAFPTAISTRLGNRSLWPSPTGAGFAGGPELVGVCGDSEPDAGEECDDGNTASGDGCSSTCLVEAGADCTAAVAGIYFTNLLQNGDLEQGHVGWTETSSDGLGPLCDPTCAGGGNFASDQDDGGEWWAWIGGRNAAYQGSIQQSLVIPATAATLQFDLWEAFCVPNGGTGDFITVEIDGTEVFSSGTCNDEGFYAQANSTVDLATAPGGPYNDGATHLVEILGNMDFTTGDPQTGSIFLDRFRIEAPLEPPIPPQPSVCLVGVCGDGILSSGEACDDGNTQPGDGCSASCAIEEDTAWCTPAEDPLEMLTGSLSRDEDVSDPGLESGSPNPFWAETGTQFTPICSELICGADLAADGAFFAWFGGSTLPNAQTLSQEVMISPLATELTFDLLIGVCDSAADMLEVSIDGSPVFTQYCTFDTADYEPQVIDLTTACGGASCADGFSHTLEFSASTIASNLGNSNFFVDNIRIEYPVSPDRPTRPSECVLLGDACGSDDGGFGIEKFEGGIPAGWTIFNLGELASSGWGTSNDGICGTQNWPGGNVTGGTGEAACADSDAADAVGSSDPAADQGGPNAMDTFLCTPEMDLSVIYQPSLAFTVNYQNASNDNPDMKEFMEVLVGTSAPNALSLGSYSSLGGVFDHLDSTLEISPPVALGADLAANVGDPSVWVCIRYGGNYSWFAQADNVALRSFNCDSLDAPDSDGDGVLDPLDNCPGDWNAGQEDFDGDGVGYACDSSCASTIDFFHWFSAGDLFSIQASQSIDYQGIVYAGANVALGGNQRVALKNSTVIELGAVFSMGNNGCTQ